MKKRLSAIFLTLVIILSFTSVAYSNPATRPPPPDGGNPRGAIIEITTPYETKYPYLNDIVKE